MKNILLSLFLIGLAACNCTAPSSDSGKDKETVLQTDKDFNDYCAKHGQAAGFIKYADSSQISMGQGSLPIRGIDALRKKLAKGFDDSTASKLTWVPEKAEASGNLAYTFGPWKYAGKTKTNQDTIYHCFYITVWKKQKDGSWKYVLDGGNDTPNPNK